MCQNALCSLAILQDRAHITECLLVCCRIGADVTLTKDDAITIVSNYTMCISKSLVISYIMFSNFGIGHCTAVEEIIPGSHIYLNRKKCVRLVHAHVVKH